MRPHHFQEVVALQHLAFPPPFDEELLWKVEHLQAHVDKFPSGQWVALENDAVIGSCSNTLVNEDAFQGHRSFDELVGGYTLDKFDSAGTVLYGLDISVHPDHRRRSIGRFLYEHRKDVVRHRGLSRYGTACRIPDFRDSGIEDVREYVDLVRLGKRTDRTLTPMFRYGLWFSHVIHDYMEDPESRNLAVCLEWRP